MSKWKEFEKSPNYYLVDLGRPAVFFIPARKLRKRIGRKTVTQELHDFLIRHFSAYTTSRTPSLGFWKGVSQTMREDTCVVYEVSFLGKHQIPLLLNKLAEIARAIHEECIYLKAGQYTCLVYPSG